MYTRSEVEGQELNPASKGSNAVGARTRAWLDRLEQAVVTVFYLWLVARIWPGDLEHWYPILLLVSEGIVAAFMLVRRPTLDISTRGWDWAIAVTGTLLALLVRPGGAPLALLPGMLLLILGILAHTGAKLSLNRSFGLVAANRGVQVLGFYRLVRHPMYAGYFLSHVGYLLIAPSLWNLAIYIGVWGLLIARLIAEERSLDADPAYVAYRKRVRYCLLPGVF